jgi:glycosyltransferase involved in cell wall biosynthesis
MSLAVIVPTYRRADMLEALVANIHEATESEHRIYLVMELADKPTLWASKTLDAISVIGTFGSCSRAVNAGYRASTEPFVAVTNDDCIFHPGWDTAALRYFSEQTHIVGCNDGMGDCKCWPMVRRSFIEEHSGVFDKPNTIFHTYKSQGPDTELAFYAMLRGVWANAYDAVVEHRRIITDKARDTITEDLAEYNRRWPLWDPNRVMPPAVPTVTPR